MWNRNANVKNILGSLSLSYFLMVELFLEFLWGLVYFWFNHSSYISFQSKENYGVLNGIIIARHHTPTWWVECDFSQSIASEFSDEECDCCTTLFFICQSLEIQGILVFLAWFINYKHVNGSYLFWNTLHNVYHGADRLNV